MVKNDNKKKVVACLWFDLGAADWKYFPFVLDFYEKLLKYLENVVDSIAFGMDYEIKCL